MKMVMIIYSLAVDGEVLDTIHQLGIRAYTRWPRLTGSGPQTGPRLDDHIWPGANCAVMAVLDTPSAEKLIDAMQHLRDTIGKKEGIYAFMLNVEKCTQ